MNDSIDAFRVLADLASEGARRFGDDPCAIRRFVDAELVRMSEPERKRVLDGLSIATETDERSH